MIGKEQNDSVVGKAELLQADENVRIQRVRLEHGLITPLELLDTENQLTSTQLSLADAIVRYKLEWASLNLLLGREPVQWLEDRQER